jgi:flagellar export protein FliJ
VTRWERFELKKFRFRLQNVLELREKELQEKQIECSKIKFLLKSQTDVLDEIVFSIESAKKSLENLINSKNLDITLIESNKVFVKTRTFDKENQKKLIQYTEDLLDKKNNELLDVMRKKTMLEKLKEKDFREYMKNIDSTERKELDEVGLMRYSR